MQWIVQFAPFLIFLIPLANNFKFSKNNEIELRTRRDIKQPDWKEYLQKPKGIIQRVKGKTADEDNRRIKSAPQELVGIMKKRPRKKTEPKKRVRIKSEGSILKEKSREKEEKKGLLDKTAAKSDDDQSQLADDLPEEEEEKGERGTKEGGTKTWLQRLRELKANKGDLREFRFEARMAVKMSDAIEELKEFLTNNENQRNYNQKVLHSKDLIPQEFEVPNWGKETCKWIQGEFNELIRGGRRRGNEEEKRRKRREEEELVEELDEMLAWPHELEEIVGRAKREVEEFQKEMKKPNRNERLVSPKLTTNAALLELASFRMKANKYIEKMIGLVRLYPLEFYTIDEELNKTNEAIEKLIKNSVEMFRQLGDEHGKKRLALIREGIEAKVPELTRCPWVVMVWGESRTLNDDQKKELYNCLEVPDLYVEKFWNLPSAEDWKLYFPKEKAEPPQILVGGKTIIEPPELDTFKEDLLYNFSRFRLYGFVEAAVEGEHFFEKFYFNEKKLEQMKFVLEKLKSIWSIHWMGTKRGRWRREKLKNQIKSLELLVTFARELNSTVKKMSDDIVAHMKAAGAQQGLGQKAQIVDGIARRISHHLVVKHGRWRKKAAMEPKIIDNVHLLILQWAPMYLDLRLLLELNKRTKELFGVIRQLSLVSEKKLKDAPKFDESAQQEMAKSIEEKVRMEEEMMGDMGILDWLGRNAENGRMERKARKEMARLGILHQKFLAFHKAHSRVKILLACLELDEANLTAKVEEKRRETIGGKIVRKISRVITRISDYFAGRSRAITYEKYKAEQFHEEAQKRMRDLVGKVLIVESKIAEKWNGEKKSTNGDHDFRHNEMRGEDLEEEEKKAEKPKKKPAICHAGVEEDVPKEIIKLLSEMFTMHFDVKKYFG